MQESSVTVSAEKTGRTIHPLHGVCGGPLTYDFYFDTSRYFREARIPYARLHDIEYPLGGGHFVDIHCIFPNFSADPDQPSSYDFYYTDKYIAAIAAAGCKTFYRLGESIDHSPFPRYVRPPQDNAKWAAVCEHIIRHYNEGWADGFHYDIRYWEIWNEPEGPDMWTGTKEEYFELYRVTANHLKKEFPHLKIGGYASCGFYELTRGDKIPDLYRTFIPYFRDFLKFCSAPETRSPLDFFSWHIYTSDPKEIAAHAAFTRRTLDEAGFAAAESILDEWNYGGDNMFELMRSEHGAAFAAKTLCLLQRPETAVNAAMYYDAQPRQGYGGLFLRGTTTPSKTYYAFKAFSELYALGSEAGISVHGAPDCCAAANGEKRAVIAANYAGEPTFMRFRFDGACRPLKVYLLDKDHDLDLAAETVASECAVPLGTDSVALAVYG